MINCLIIEAEKWPKLPVRIAVKNAKFHSNPIQVDQFIVATATLNIDAKATIDRATQAIYKQKTCGLKTAASKCI